jgi:hypothetical protein
MAYFCKLTEEGIVENVIVVSDSDAQNEAQGIQFLTRLYGGHPYWKKCDRNTRDGVHYEPNSNTPSADQSQALRWNYPGIDWKYDAELDAFIPPKPYPSWTFNSATRGWDSPQPHPTYDPENPVVYQWNESTQTWDAI